MSGLKAKAEAAAKPAAAPAPPQFADYAAAGASPGLIIDVTEETFEDAVLRKSMEVPVVVDLWASWCEPCKALTPVLEKLAAEYGGKFVLAKVDVEANPGLAQVFRVQSVPTVIAVAAGQPVTDFQGAQPEDQLRKWIDAILKATEGKLSGAPSEDGEENQPVDEPLQRAYDAMDAADYALAEQRFEELVATRKGDKEVLAALRTASVMKRESERAEDASDELSVADRLVITGQFSQAFDSLISVVSAGGTQSCTAEDAKARLFELFDIVPGDDPQVLAARRKLANALY